MISLNICLTLIVPHFTYGIVVLGSVLHESHRIFTKELLTLVVMFVKFYFAQHVKSLTLPVTAVLLI